MFSRWSWCTIVILPFGVLWACGKSAPRDDDDSGASVSASSTGAGANTTVPGGPEVALVASPTSMTEDGTIIFTATVTDDDGLQDIVGGTLKSGDGADTYLPFTQESAGVFSAALTWSQLNAVEPINFQQDLVKTVRAEFMDTTRKVGSATVEITLSCDGCAATNGECASGCSTCQQGVDTPCEQCAFTSCNADALACASLSTCDSAGNALTGCLALVTCTFLECGDGTDVACVLSLCARELESAGGPTGEGTQAAQALGDCISAQCSSQCI